MKKVKRLRCPGCGQEFETAGTRTYLCRACQREKDLVYSRERHKATYQRVVMADLLNPRWVRFVDMRYGDDVHPQDEADGNGFLGRHILWSDFKEAFHHGFYPSGLVVMRGDDRLIVEDSALVKENGAVYLKKISMKKEVRNGR
jgi:phage FluMu protein Com